MPTTAAPETRLDRLLRSRPDVVFMAPFMIYLLLLGLRDAEWLGLGYELRWLTSLIRGVGALAALWLVRKHLPPWGKPHWRLAIPVGLLVAVGWVVGQHACDAFGLPHRLPLFPSDGAAPIDPRDQLGAYKLFWATVVSRISVAVVVVPLVEELFWRAFLLRAFISWSDFESVPLGKFAWMSFLGTSLLSTIQHPDNWVVSIFCWMAYNALFCWKRSILLLVLTHGITNLALYVYVVRANDWIFW